MRLILITGLLFLVVGCDNMKFKIVTDSKVQEQIDLLTQHGPWLCEGTVGEGDETTDFKSTQVWMKTGPDTATTYMQATFGNAAVEFTTSEVDFMTIKEAGTVIQTPQLFEFEEVRLTPELKSQIPYFSSDRVQQLNLQLAQAKSSFALDSSKEFENPTLWKLGVLTTEKLSISNELGTINCSHANPSALFNDFGLIVK